jgi:hypothetical protein
MTDNSFKHANYIIRCLVSVGFILFGITLMRGPSDPSGIPVIVGALVIGAGALILIISLIAWFFFAIKTKREGTIVNAPTPGRPADATEQSPAPRKRNMWGTILEIIYWWWRM